MSTLPAALPTDVLTIGSSVLSVLCFVSLFVSSKPVTLGGCFMVLLLTASVTQAIMGLHKLANAPLEAPQEAPAAGSARGAGMDVLDHARAAWVWFAASHGSNAS